MAAHARLFRVPDRHSARRSFRLWSWQRVSGRLSLRRQPHLHANGRCCWMSGRYGARRLLLRRQNGSHPRSLQDLFGDESDDQRGSVRRSDAHSARHYLAAAGGNRPASRRRSQLVRRLCLLCLRRQTDLRKNWWRFVRQRRRWNRFPPEPVVQRLLKRRCSQLALRRYLYCRCLQRRHFGQRTSGASR